MKLMKQLRCKMRAMRRRPKVYARHYGLAIFLRGMLLFLEVVLLRFFIYMPLRLADMSPRELVQYMRNRNRRMVRRGAFRMVLGVILAKLMTVLYVAFAGAAMFSIWGIDCLFMILGFLQLAATRIAHVLGRVIEHHIYLVQQGADFAGEGKGRISLGKRGRD